MIKTTITNFLTASLSFVVASLTFPAAVLYPWLNTFMLIGWFDRFLRFSLVIFTTAFLLQLETMVSSMGISYTATTAIFLIGLVIGTVTAVGGSTGLALEAVFQRVAIAYGLRRSDKEDVYQRKRRQSRIQGNWLKWISALNDLRKDLENLGVGSAAIFETRNLFLSAAMLIFLYFELLLIDIAVASAALFPAYWLTNRTIFLTAIVAIMIAFVITCGIGTTVWNQQQPGLDK